MNCPKIKILLSSYLDNELNKNEKMLLDNHLTECQNCRQELQQLLNLKKILKAKESPELLPFFETRLQNRIRQKEENMLLSPSFIGLASKMLLVVAGFLLIVIILNITGADIPKNISVDNYLLPEVSTNNINENNILPEKNITREDVIVLAYYN